jgi:RnfABCDGE-type electron transport complex B subunit
MDINVILIPVFSVSAIGVILAAILCLASKLMYVKIDERTAKLQEVMPGVNCGVCGYPGCSGYAVALASGDAKPNLCTPGGIEVLEKISSILGVETGSIEKKCAFIYCSGDCNAQKKKMDYKGIQSCEAAMPLFGGENACTAGCLGYGDCQTACPSNAICMLDGLARIITDLCTGCGLCVTACPKKIISIENAYIPVHIACKNIEKGVIVRKKCNTGCIACTKCVRECPNGAIAIENNLAVIDYEKCMSGNNRQSCGHCAEVCLTKCILVNPAKTNPH